MTALTAQIQGWRDADPDPATVAALDDLVTRADAGDAAASAELASAFAAPLAFGTAGLRGPMGPGPARMNRVVVAQAAAGLGAYLTQTGQVGATVIVGYDARHNSEIFARDTAEILAAAGLVVLLSDQALPTPVTAFGIRHYGCAAGVVVTASHNPAQDNGYKVYLGDGSQIVPPVDAQIAACIAEVSRRPLSDIPRSNQYQVIGDELLDAYLARAASLVSAPTTATLNWVYTALHGVGAAVVDTAVKAAGFAAPQHVWPQNEPDPDFPTLSFPNPEEPGAIDLALALAQANRADLAIANDPDADRCALAVPVAGSWRMLTGDELGVLLADDLLRRGTTGVYACSVVSSTQLSAMAAAYDQPQVTTLTGFKWIGRVPNLVFGYEEAIGYCTDPNAVADKDGITTLLRILALATELKAQGHTISDRLDELAERYGVYLTSQVAFRTDRLDQINNCLTRLRAEPPTTLAGVKVTMADLAVGWQGLPATDALAFTGEGLRVVVRPSGTEPKLKCYLQVWGAPAPTLVAARAEAADRLAVLTEEVTKALRW